MTLLEGFLWLTLNVYHEARSEPQVAQIAVAHVTLNRAKIQNMSIEDVVKEPHQFNWVRNKSYFPHNMPVFLQCMQSAFIALSTSDFTAGATHFHLQTRKPKWSQNLTFVDKYGKHKFYRE